MTKKASEDRKRPHGAQEYLGNGKHDWETVIATNNDGWGLTPITVRLRVPGGWLYRIDRGGPMAFVPVPEAVGYAV